VRTARRWERSVEWVLGVGVAVSGALLIVGLILEGEALLEAGVVLLMITPGARVLVLTVGLLWEGDRRFGFVSLGVLAILVFGFLFAHS
jgi:uncharacterized membrane protein